MQKLLPFIPTGARALDAMLGGGARAGFVTDFYGESGSGKSQLCFSLCASCARAGGRAMFIDTAGTFRPERIVEMAGKEDGGSSRGGSNVLDRIAFVRALGTADQLAAVERAKGMDLQLLIVDTLTSLFSAEYSGPARHLAVMSHLHDLAVYAITSGCAVVVTNMVRNVPVAYDEEAQQQRRQWQGSSPTTPTSIQREYLGSSVSLYSHVRVRLSIEDPARGAFRATPVQPPPSPQAGGGGGGGEAALFSITTSGIQDRQ